MTDTKISALPDECLYEIFLHVPVLQRVKLREVCKGWNRIVDDCWREVKQLTILEPKIGQDATRITTCGEKVEMTTCNGILAVGFVRQCARYLTTLEHQYFKRNFSVLPVMKESCRLRRLKISLSFASDAFHLGFVLTNNKNLQCFHVRMYAESTCGFLCRLRTNCLRDLSLWVGTAVEPENVPFWLTVIKGTIHNCRMLEKLSINCPYDEILEAIGEKSRLLELEIVESDLCGLTDDGLNNLLKLSCLKMVKIMLCEAQITKDFVENLSQCCIELDRIVLGACSGLPVDDFLNAKICGKSPKMICPRCIHNHNTS